MKRPTIAPPLSQTQEGARTVVALSGEWTIANAAQLDRAIAAVTAPAGAALTLDLSAVDRFDTVGAWLVHRARARLVAAGVAAEVTGASEGRALLIREVTVETEHAQIAPPHEHVLHEFVRRLGENVTNLARGGTRFLGFLGAILITVSRTIVRPGRLRLTSLVHHMEETGLKATPIVCLMSFLIGVVLAYQGADQLRSFGAEVFTVNLVSVSVLREIGVLLTAIIIAGRSGSAFTAQIGSMKVREEVDAMRVIGLDVFEVLVAPRVVALVLTLPLLAFLAAMMGLLGGALMCWTELNISPAMFLARLNDSTSVWHLYVGLIKAPFFALMIGAIGCYQGLQVAGSSESVGRLTTRSVVHAIFSVIVVDAVFSIFFSIVGV